MKCVVNCIPLRICVRSRNTQPHLNQSQAVIWFHTPFGIAAFTLSSSSRFMGLLMIVSSLYGEQQSQTLLNQQSQNGLSCLWLSDSLISEQLSSWNLIEGNPPTWAGFLFTMFPHQEPCVRGPPSKNLVQIHRGGSFHTRFLMRELVIQTGSRTGVCKVSRLCHWYWKML